MSCFLINLQYPTPIIFFSTLQSYFSYFCLYVYHWKAPGCLLGYFENMVMTDYLEGLEIHISCIFQQNSVSYIKNKSMP